MPVYAARYQKYMALRCKTILLAAAMRVSRIVDPCGASLARLTSSRTFQASTPTPDPYTHPGEDDHQDDDHRQCRLTGDEVEDTSDPVVRAGHRVTSAVNKASRTVRGVLDASEDPIRAAGEEGKIKWGKILRVYLHHFLVGGD